MPSLRGKGVNAKFWGHQILQPLLHIQAAPQRSAYDRIEGANDLREKPLWSRVWKWKGPQRMRTLFWLLAEDSLPANSLCCKRKLIPTFAQEAEEVKKQRSVPSDIAHLKLMSGVILFLMRMSSSIPIHDSCQTILHSCNEIAAAEASDSALSLNRLCLWSLPEEGIVNLNTDGAFVGMESRASAGGVIRDCRAGWLSGFGYNIGKCSPLDAKLWEALAGLDMASRQGYRKIILEMDSSLALEYISSKRAVHGSAKEIVRRVHVLLSRDRVVQIKWPSLR
ncbi:conserved hypothetical protein [Ricinus communis]|uniref:RNase H type-1 domain-containing protein n=1 Tax=Ricinus communis TaxID=3988 RepID=B9S2H5_RICCO|nr:conserved hypothetical protein [Ricinus communis]